MNKIVLYFLPCTPAPAGGYNIKYRVAGSDSAYTDAGSFYISPAVFYDTVNPPGTCYEGFIRTDCGVLGNPVYWNSCESGESGEVNGTHFGATVPIAEDSLHKLEIAHLIGTPGATVTIKVTTYVNTNGGTVSENGIPVILGDEFNIVLDGSGLGSFDAEIDGVVNAGTFIFARFSITAVTAGGFGTPAYYQITKMF